jgi:hypothetical protein
MAFELTGKSALLMKLHGFADADLHCRYQERKRSHAAFRPACGDFIAMNLSQGAPHV